jgi:hypothetical protein
VSVPPEGGPPGQEPPQQPPSDPGQPPPPPQYGAPPQQYAQPPQQYAQPPYGAQPQYSLPNAPGAVLSLVLGIIGITACGLTAPFAWAQGRKAEQAFDASPGSYGGKGMATAGKILGIIGTVLLAVGVLFFFIYVIVLIATEAS